MPKELTFNRTDFKVIESTQDYLKEHAAKLLVDTDGVVVTANEQTKGRGTSNRMWASPPDVNIYATFAVKIPNEFTAYFDLIKSPAVMEIMALAVAKTLEDFGLKPTIKWRNDVLLNGKKVCGILCEPVMTSVGGVGLIGIGLNVNMSSEICNTLDQPVTSMAVAAGIKFDKEKVFASLVKHVTHYSKLYLDKKFATCIPEIEARLAFKNEIISVQTQLGKVSGICLGIDENGCLKIKGQDGVTQLVRWGSIIKDETAQQKKSKSDMTNAAFPLGAAFGFYRYQKPSQSHSDHSQPKPATPSAVIPQFWQSRFKFKPQVNIPKPRSIGLRIQPVSHNVAKPLTALVRMLKR